MKKTIGLLFLIFLNTIVSIQAQEKPNVIYILADDLGYGDLSCYGQEKFTTPNIDKLAEGGMKFTDHYSGNTVCSPSRAVLMTGQHPGNCYITGNSKHEFPMKSSLTTLAEVFKNAGYQTGAYGKWGLGHTNVEGEKNPLNNGFDEFYGWESQVTAHTYYPKHMVHNGKKITVKKGAYVHDLIMEKAFNFIKTNAESDKPFFCYIPTAIPHAAMHAPKKLHDEWRKKLPQFEHVVGKYYAKTEPCPDVQNPVAAFPAMVQHLDSQVGQIMDILKKYKVDKNTLVVFTSDNGAHKAGGHNSAFWNSNGELRGWKRDVYEGGIRAPMLAYWPSKIEAGSVTNLPSAFWDVMPTMAEILQQPVPKQCDGISFLPTLQGDHNNQKKAAYLYWKFTNSKATKQAIRIGDYKGVSIFNNKAQKLLPFELYNLASDLGEQKNIASQKQEIVSQMQKIIEQFNK